jgi:hypothetical protein
MFADDQHSTTFFVHSFIYLAVMFANVEFMNSAALNIVLIFWTLLLALYGAQIYYLSAKRQPKAKPSPSVENQAFFVISEKSDLAETPAYTYND